MPTLVAMPVPSGPVVHSTPEVQRYSGCPGHFESSWRNRLQVVERDRGRAHGLVVRVDRLDPGQVQQRVEQRRGVPGGQHEPVAVGPHRQLRVEPQEPRPERVAHRGQRHRRARMPRVRRLHRVHRQHADGVDGQLVDRLGVEVDVRLGPYGHRSGPSFVGVDESVVERLECSACRSASSRLEDALRVRPRRYSAFGPVSGSVSRARRCPAGSDVEPLASLRGCPPAATSVPSWLHRVWQ